MARIHDLWDGSLEKRKVPVLEKYTKEEYFFQRAMLCCASGLEMILSGCMDLIITS